MSKPRSPKRHRSVSVPRLAAATALDLDGPRPDYDRAFQQLCYLVSLSRTNKKPQVIEALVQTVLVDPSVSCSDATDMRDAILGRFGLPVSAAEVDASLSAGFQHAWLQRGGDRRLMLSAYQQAVVLERINNAGELEKRVQRRWLDGVRSAGIADLITEETLWECLRCYMARVFRQHGVRATQLLEPAGARSEEQLATLAEELEQAAQENNVRCSEGLRAAVNAFFTDATADRARYLAQLLDNTFTFFALATPVVANRYLRTHLRPLKLFLDTNILFDLLGLHEDPGVSIELVKFVRDNELQIELFAHERSLKEFLGTVEGATAALCSRQWKQHISKAALLTEISGFERSFHAKNAVQPIDPRAFMARYEGVEDLLGEYGVKIYRDSASIDQTEEKSLLINELKAYLETSGKAEKPYNILDHDAVLYLAVQREREDADNALDCGAMLVTNDGSLAGFDNFKVGRHSVLSVSLPAQLLQVLRPLGVPTVDFDQRFVETFAIPEFRTAHNSYEGTASKVLGFLASFEDVPAETAARIMGNHLLLTELSALEEGSPEFASRIESAFVEENVRLAEEKDNLKRLLQLREAAQLAQLDQERAKHREELAAKDREVAAAQDASERAGRVRDDEFRRELQEMRSEDDARWAAAEKRYERNIRNVRVALATVLWVCASLLVVFGPDHWHIKSILNMSARKRCQGLTVVILLSLAWGFGYPKHRKWMLGVLGLTAAFTLITLA